MQPSKINYQNKLDQILAALPKDRIPTLWLHACCAPCSSYVLEYLSQYFAITLFFYNPNIAPADEYLHRKDELCRLALAQPHRHPVQVVDGDYVPKRFLELAQGHQHEPERGVRCRRCIGHRLEQTYLAAIQQPTPPDYVATTLSISPHKDAAFINTKGEALAAQHHIPWLYADFKKKGGYQRSIVLSREYDLYRQDYCGCIYSKLARDARLEERQDT